MRLSHTAVIPTAIRSMLKARVHMGCAIRVIPPSPSIFCQWGISPVDMESAVANPDVALDALRVKYITVSVVSLL